MLDLGVGLTDFCKTGWGVDAVIPRETFDRPAFAKKVARLKPGGLAFTSKTAAGLWLGAATGRIATGRQLRLLLWHQDLVREMRTMPLPDPLDAVDAQQISADAVDHPWRASPIRRRSSATAAGRP